MIALGLIAMMLAAAPAAGAEAKDCRPRDSMPGPIVPTAEAAKAIYLAIEKGTGFRADPKIYTDVIVSDQGDSWSASRDLIARRRQNEKSDVVIVIMGGGQLTLEIDKCTGEISHAHFIK